MKNTGDEGLDFRIDKLTNSVVNIVTGDSFTTDVTLVSMEDLKSITKKMDGFLTGNMNYCNPREKSIS